MNSPKTQSRWLERILAINQNLVANRSLNDILHQIVQTATELVDCEAVGILLQGEQPDILRFVATTQYHDRIFNIRVPIDASIAGAAFNGDGAIIVDHVQQDPRHYPQIAEILNYPALSLLAVPLKFQDRKIGVLEAVNKKNDQYFDETDTQVLTALATQATIAIENERQVDRYKQLAQAEQNQRQIADALRIASTALANTLDYDQVIDRILEQISQIIPSDTSNVMMIESGNIARVFRGYGYTEFGAAETLSTITLSVNDVAGLRRMRETRQPIIVPDVAQDPTWVYSRPEHHWIQSYVGAPIVMHNTVVGFLNAMSATPNLYYQMHADRLQAFAHHAATAIENARLYRQAQEEITERIKIEEELRRHRDHLEELVKERTAEVHRLAITDPLTGIFNRHYLIRMGQQALSHAQRYGHPLAVILLDIDHFKIVNDTYGHAVGDEVLRALAGHIRENLRSADILSRYGGEEFVIVLPQTNLESARQFAERLLASIQGLRVNVGQIQIGITTSIGVTELNPARPQTLDELISCADQAMYTAKQAGRNQACTQCEK